ncbi:MAG TPA: hypothetical protein VJO52_07575 [Gemmatimonadaceae bacterium]|nr:hypothetical protein [Gemmatimonadaceae bacterium]
MRFRADTISRTDRVASAAAASGLTLASALLVLTSQSPRLTAMSDSAPRHDVERAADHVTYVSPVAHRAVTHAPPAVRSNARLSPRPRVASPTRENVTPAARPAAASDSSAGARPLPNRTPPAVSAFQRQWTAHGVSPLLLPGAPSEPASAGASTPRGATIRIPVSDVDRDAQLRAKAREAIAAQAAGSPLPTTPGGISIDAPIPFGGPSNAQRKRDSTINAQTKAVLVRVRQRLDSIAAARRRQHADSAGGAEPQR